MASLVFLFFFLFVTSNSQLSPNFYDLTCPEALSAIKTSVSPFILREPRVAASLIRLHFHDCFVQGCDASILLDNTFSIKSKMDVLPNKDSVFSDNGLSARDMVALSGAHTVGQARCFLFVDRIYWNRSDIDEEFASTLRRGCPICGNSYPAPLDFVTPEIFDNNYFNNLMQKKGLLESDQVLFSGGSTDDIVREYNVNSSLFMSEFSDAMVKLSEVNPLTGEAGL